MLREGVLFFSCLCSNGCKKHKWVKKEKNVIKRKRALKFDEKAEIGED